MTQFIQVLTTTDKKPIAEKIRNALIKKRLAGCVQVTTIDSAYRWKGKIVHAKEYLLLIKTRKSLYKQLEKAIMTVHNYSVPEIIATPIISGNQKYLNWLKSETK